MSRAPFFMSRAPSLSGALFRAFSTATLDGADHMRPHLATCTVPLRDSLTWPL